MCLPQLQQAINSEAAAAAAAEGAGVPNGQQAPRFTPEHLQVAAAYLALQQQQVRQPMQPMHPEQHTFINMMNMP